MMEAIQKILQGRGMKNSIEEVSRDKGILALPNISTSPDGSYQIPQELEAKVGQEMRNLIRKFAALQTKVHDALVKQNQTTKGYAVFFTSLVEEAREDLAQNPSHIAKAYRDKELGEIFEILTTSKVWSFLNYQVLLDAVVAFGDENLQGEVKRYEQKVAEFRASTKFVDFLHVWHSRHTIESLPDCETFIARLDERWKGFTLQDVANTQKYLAGEFKLRSLIFRLTNGRPGSVTIMWHIISSAVELIMEGLKLKPNLALGNVQELWIGKQLVFQADQYRSMYMYGKIKQDDPQKFWSEMGNLFLDWIEPFSDVCKKGDDGVMKWFPGGKLNASVLCLDRHVAKTPDKTALIWERNDSAASHEEVSYQELHQMTCKLANVLKRCEVTKGDKVVIYMPASPMAVAAMLACARIGAVHCVAFSSSDAESLLHKVKETKASILITANEAPYGNTFHHLKANVDEALAMEEGSTQVRLVLVTRHTEARVSLTPGRDIDLDEEMKIASDKCDPVPMESEDELFIMYTSGTTNAAKGIVHTHAGYLLYVSATHKYVFDYRPGDVFACIADLGWITGHSYVVYGPLCNGATSVLFESTPLYPNCDHFWEMIERLKVNQLYAVPAVLKHLKKEGDVHLRKYQRKTLKTVGSVGEPLNDDTRKWVFQEVGQNRCTLIDTWWQTELGGIAITLEYTPSDTSKEPSVEIKPFFGVEPVIMDPMAEHEVDEGTGDLYLAKAIPGMGRAVLQTPGCVPDAFNEFANIEQHKYCTKDMVKFDPKCGKVFRVIGRTDDAVRHKGVYIIVPDIENELEKANGLIQDVALVALKPEETQTKMHHCDDDLDKCIYVSCTPGAVKEGKLPEVKESIKKVLANHQLGDQHIQGIEELPKTASGKLQRHPLKDRWFLKQGVLVVGAKKMKEYIRKMPRSRL